jgi:hypothetical protein
MNGPKLVRIEPDRYSPVVKIESPSYITVRVSKSVHDPNVYWQLVDPTFSLLELGFDARSGRLVSCSVPLFNGNVGEHDEALGHAGLPGTPIFEMKPWTSLVGAGEIPRGVLKTAGRIRLDRYSDALVINISAEATSTVVVSGGNFACCFGSEGRLQSISLFKPEPDRTTQDRPTS